MAAYSHMTIITVLFQRQIGFHFTHCHQAFVYIQRKKSVQLTNPKLLRLVHVCVQQTLSSIVTKKVHFGCWAECGCWMWAKKLEYTLCHAQSHSLCVCMEQLGVHVCIYCLWNTQSILWILRILSVRCFRCFILVPWSVITGSWFVASCL